MTALAAARNTPAMLGGPNPENLSFPIKDNVKIFKGSLVVLDAGYAAPGSTATGKISIGRAEETVDNTTTGHVAGRYQVPIKQGVFKFANSAAGDAIAQADVGGLAYIVDDQTVAKTDGTGTRSAAGRIVQVDTSGVWVELGLGGIDYLAAGGDLTGTMPAPTVAAGKISPLKTANADAGGLGHCHVIRKAVAAGAGGAADDVELYNAAAPFKFRVLDTIFICTAGNAGGRTVTLRTAAAGGGTALSDALDCATTGRKVGSAAVATAAVAAAGSLYLRRSDSAVAGELMVLIEREA